MGVTASPISAEQDNAAMPRPLRVGLLAGTPARRDVLAALIRDSGHIPALPGSPADVVLIDGVAQRSASTPSVLLLEGGNVGDTDVVLPPSPTPRQLDAALRGAAAGLVVRAKPPETGFAPAPNGGLRPPLLTPREVEILLAVGEGLSNKEVARRLGISQHTVKFHLEAVFTKLNAGSRAEAVAKGLRQGLIEL
jgi:DNA-binding CsgD family transcriptional regulator